MAQPPQPQPPPPPLLSYDRVNEARSPLAESFSPRPRTSAPSPRDLARPSAASSILSRVSASSHSRGHSNASTINSSISESYSESLRPFAPIQQSPSQHLQSLQSSPSQAGSPDTIRSPVSPRRSISLRSFVNPLSGSPQRHSRRSPSTHSVLRKPIPESLVEDLTYGAPEKVSFLSALRARARTKGAHENLFGAITLPSRPSTAADMATVAHRPAPAARPSGTSHSNYSFGGPEKPISTSNGQPTATSGGVAAPQNPYQHIVDTASKRISTLDYLRKAHEDRIYWFNTVLMNRQTLATFPSFTPAKLARRATNLLLLGYSLPTILDLNSATIQDYLKALSALLSEFETYQSAHGVDGEAKGSSYSRGRLPGIFKRAVVGGGGGGKNRRASSANESSGFFGTSSSTSNGAGNNDGVAFAPMTMSATAGGYDMSDPNYTYLLTAPLPFDPDFFEVFTTLCDILIDCYTRITQLINNPEQPVLHGQGVSELFLKADGKIRKLLLANIVREFEDKSREGIRTEVAGVSRVVLGGLM